MNKLCRLAATLAYAAITYAQWPLIEAGLLSLAGSAGIALAHPSRAASVMAPPLFEYWIACALWCAVPLVAGVKLWRRFAIRRPAARSHAPDRPLEHANRIIAMPASSAARTILMAAIILALCAPVIAPLPPLAQGSLEHTRFLAPLSIGISQTLVPVSDSQNGVTTNDEFPALRRANRFLLRRTVNFSGAIGWAAPAGMAPAEQEEYTASSSPVMFLFGTDAVGRDIFSRVVYGARYSIGIGFAVVLFSITLGSGIGMAAGFRGGIIDAGFMRTIDILMSIPTLFLVLTLMAILGQSVTAMILVLTATEWMGIARIVRGEVIHLRGREFISASRLLGTSSAGILRRHIWPNVRPTIIYAAVLQLGNIFLAEASLSFLGLGIQAPNPSWGNMIAESMGHMSAGMWTGIFPGAALSVLIAAVHIIGGAEQ